MRKRGKFEARSRVTAANQETPQGRYLLQMLMTSVISLMLCCTMFLSTTMAWFTDTISSSSNQITIGVLQVALLSDGVPLSKARSNTSLFGSNIAWMPDTFEVKDLTVINEGNLPLKYSLNFQLQTDDASVAQYFHVYTKFGGTGTTEELTASTIKSNWKPIGDLSSIFIDGLSIFNGELGVGESQTYAVAVCMGTDIPTDTDIQGKQLELNVLLHAYQNNTPNEVAASSLDIETDDSTDTDDEAGTFNLTKNDITGNNDTTNSDDTAVDDTTDTDTTGGTNNTSDADITDTDISSGTGNNSNGTTDTSLENAATDVDQSVAEENSTTNTKSTGDSVVQ